MTTKERLESLECNLFMLSKFSTVFTPLGVLGEPELQLFRKFHYTNHFEIRSARQMPNVKDLNDRRRQVATETHVFLRTYVALEGILGFKKWPNLLVIENIETLSDDQALALRGCFSDREADGPEDWPKSIFLVLKDGSFLHPDLAKFLFSIR